MSTARLIPADDPNAYARWVRRQRAYGRWEPFVDAQPARDHAWHVMATADIGWRRLADLSGVARSTVTNLLYGNSGHLPARIHPENARKLLALQADSARGITMPATGSQRRIQALATEGWPQIRLAPVIGTHRAYVCQILIQQRITAPTAERVASAYERLRGANPLDHGVTPHGVGLAKGIARRNGWLDRAYWDDVDRIDDAEFDPHARQLRIEQIAEDAEFLLARGLDTNQAAERLGITRDYLTKALRETAGKPVAA